MIVAVVLVVLVVLVFYLVIAILIVLIIAVILVIFVVLILLVLILILLILLILLVVLILLIVTIVLILLVHITKPPFRKFHCLLLSLLDNIFMIAIKKGVLIIIIKNAKIFTMAGRSYDSGSILIKKGKIKEISNNVSIHKESDDEIIDAQGNWVMPGLIDAHSHIGISEEKKGSVGNDCNETTEPITPYLKAIDAINPMDSAFHNAIKAGITSVMVGPGSSNVVGGQFVFMKTSGRNVDEMVVLEPAAMKIAFGENPKNNYGNNNLMPSTRMSIGSMLREELFEAQKYIEQKKACAESGSVFEENFRKECWIPVFEKKIPLKAHVHRTDDILTAIRIAKLFDLNITLDHCTEGHLIAQEIKQSGYPAIVGPSLASRNKIEVQYMDFKTSGLLFQAGVKVAITTDHPVSLIQSLPLCAGLAAKEGLGIDEGLKAITINAAEICNVASRVGSLEAGKDADVAIYNGNPMETFTKCLYTIIDGNVVYRDSE